MHHGTLALLAAGEHQSDGSMLPKVVRRGVAQSGQTSHILVGQSWAAPAVPRWARLCNINYYHPAIDDL
ncbi:unnamed protein product [Ilex paraguariensis]|uniref:Uncharacterized protein n=1 Tax=Ilex paraguariensis TaxID=185542 RepID=A0ABC8V4N9_9AQUA